MEKLMNIEKQINKLISRIGNIDPHQVVEEIENSDHPEIVAAAWVISELNAHPDIEPEQHMASCFLEIGEAQNYDLEDAERLVMENAVPFNKAEV